MFHDVLLSCSADSQTSIFKFFTTNTSASTRTIEVVEEDEGECRMKKEYKITDCSMSILHLHNHHSTYKILHTGDILILVVIIVSIIGI